MLFQEPDRGAGGVEPVRTCDDDAAEASTAIAAAVAEAAAGDTYAGDSETDDSPEDVRKIRGLVPTEQSGRSITDAASVFAESKNFASSNSSFRGSIGSGNNSDTNTLATVPPAAEKDEEGQGEETSLMPTLAAPAPGLPSDDRSRSSSRRSSSESSGHFFSSEPVGASGGGDVSTGVGVVRHTRGDGQGSSEAELLTKELTDEQRQVRAQESDAARAASLLRGASFRVPLQPDLERAITEEEQASAKACAGLPPRMRTRRSKLKLEFCFHRSPPSVDDLNGIRGSYFVSYFVVLL